MKKIFNSIAITLICLFSFSSCSTTFNNYEIKVLSDVDNYKEYTVKLKSFSDNNYTSNDIMVTVTFYNLDDLNEFKVTPLENVSSLDSYPISFMIHKDNSIILYNNNFYDDVNIGDSITIKANNKVIYNNRYNYIAFVSYNNKEYLSIDDGIENINIFLNENKSPFFN